MRSKDAIKFALTVSNGAVLSVIGRDERRRNDISDAERRMPSTLGTRAPHTGEGMIPAVLFGDKNPAAEWQQFFGESSEPVADVKAHPQLEEIREKYHRLRDQNPKLLDSLSEADLRKWLGLTCGNWTFSSTKLQRLVGGPTKNL